MDLPRRSEVGWRESGESGKKNWVSGGPLVGIIGLYRL